MSEISLDKSIGVTVKVMNGEVKLPNAIVVTKELGAMDRFRFLNSQVEIPIDHIGLALLSYNGAVSQYTVKRITPENQQTEEFESLLGTGAHISSFLDTISPDALNWYANREGNIKINYIGSRVPNYTPNHTSVTKAMGRDGQDFRTLAISEAYTEAMKGYVDIESEQIVLNPTTQQEQSETLHSFIEEDVSLFNASLEKLSKQSEELITPQQPEPPKDFVVPDNFTISLLPPIEQ